MVLTCQTVLEYDLDTDGMVLTGQMVMRKNGLNKKMLGKQQKKQHISGALPTCKKVFSNVIHTLDIQFICNIRIYYFCKWEIIIHVTNI